MSLCVHRQKIRLCPCLLLQHHSRDSVLGCDAVADLIQALAPSGEILLKLLQYIWSLWEDPIDVSVYSLATDDGVELSSLSVQGIRHQCKEMFQNIVKIHQHLSPSTHSLWFPLSPVSSSRCYSLCSW